MKAGRQGLMRCHDDAAVVSPCVGATCIDEMIRNAHSGAHLVDWSDHIIFGLGSLDES